MPVVATEEGWKQVLQAFVDNVTVLVFPYKNDRTPKSTDDVSLYVEADFSGYSGAITLTTWSAPLILAGHAITKPAPAIWTHNGGPTNNLIYGVCWVDAMNTLLFAERDPRSPVTVSNLLRTYAYNPVLADTAEFPG